MQQCDARPQSLSIYFSADHFPVQSSHIKSTAIRCYSIPFEQQTRTHKTCFSQFCLSQILYDTYIHLQIDFNFCNKKMKTTCVIKNTILFIYKNKNDFNWARLLIVRFDFFLMISRLTAASINILFIDE